MFKALWVRDEEPDLWAKAALLMTPGTFVLHEVAGVVAVDYSNASSMALLDPRSRKWSAEALGAVDLPESMLPEVVAATEPIATITAAFAEQSGLDASTLVAVGCGDEMAATLGAGVFAPGEVCDVVGTAEPVCAASAEPREDPTMLVECHPHADPDAWLLENPGFVSGGNLRWWRDHFAPGEREAEAAGKGDAYDLLSKDAERVAAGAEGLVFVPAMQGAMAPEWNGAARGVFYGLTLAHTRAHMTRAILEGSAFGLRDILEAMTAAGLEVRRLTIVGGRRQGAALAPDQGGRHRSAGAGADERGNHRDRGGDPRGGRLRDPRDHGRRRRRVRLVPARGARARPERREIYDEAYRRYRDVYFALKPVFERA